MKKFFLCIMIFVTFLSSAQYTPGNLVVLKVGDGTTVLGATATNVSLVQLKADGTRVDSISIPTIGISKLVLLGNSYIDGALRLSTNRQYLTFAGYDAVGGGTLSNTLDNTNKVIARVNINGVVDLSTKIIQSGAGVKIGSAISDDGSNFWLNFSNTNGTSTYPINYVPFGTVSIPTAVSDVKTNWRSVNIFGGQLLANVSNSVLSIGKTLSDVTNPTSPLTSTSLFTNNSSPSPVFSGYGFIMFDLDPTEPGYNVCYELSQGFNTTRGIVKSIKISGVWNAIGTIINTDVRAVAAAPATNPGGLIGITGTLIVGKPMLYVTRGTVANNSILSISDAGGYNASFTPTYATIANSKNNFIGIALTPGTTPNLVLPLNLSSFNGSLVNEKVFLKWTTANEVNVQSFVIEKSTDASKFTAIGQLVAKNTTEANYYSFNDSSKSESTIFYRLKIMDKDGLITYSSVIHINIKLVIGKLGAYPNPFINIVTITHGKAGKNDIIRILSLDGRIISSYKVEPDSNQTTFNLSQLLKADYLVQYFNGQDKSTVIINK